MKYNLPVFDEEIFLDEETVIVSKTDLKGMITYVNDDFCRISGYSEVELVGKNHNIIRHPDMPAAAFEDLWNKINSGKPWTGLVKNRTKSGAFYWVQANVTPVYNSGRIVEHISVRRPATEQQKQTANKTYDAINRGKPPTPPLLKRLAYHRRINLTTKFMLAGATALLLIAILLGLLARQSLDKLGRAEAELAALNYIEPLRELSQRLPEHRGLINAYLNGDHSAQSKIQNKQSQIDQAFAAVHEMDVQYDGVLDIHSRVTKLGNRWSGIKQVISQFELESEVAFMHHTELIGDILGLIADLGDSSGLNSDGSQLQHYLANILLEKIPSVNEYLGEIRGLGAGIAARGAFEPGQFERMSDLFNRVQVMLESMEDALKNVFRFDPRLEHRLKRLMDAGNEHRKTFYTAMGKGLEKAGSLEQAPGEFFAKASLLIDANFAILGETDLFMAETLELVADEARSGMSRLYLLLAGSVMAALLVGLLMVMVIRSITRGLDDVRGHFRRIAEGHYYNSIDLERGDEIGDVLCDLKSMQVKLGYDVNEARQRASTSARVKTALDNVSSSVMMVDNSASIIYLNKAVKQLFRDTEADLQRDLPEFDAAALLGSSIDQFHKYPQHQRSLLENLKGTFASEINIGGKTLGIIVNPVINEQGERLGSAVEWRDRTAEVAVEEQVENLIRAARNGDLSQRLLLDDKQGFHRNLSAGINELIDTLGQVFDEIASIMGRLSQGDLSGSINRDFKGMFAMVKDDINESLSNLREMVQQMRDANDQIILSSDEIFLGNNNLSLRTDEQASMLEETASSMEELTSTVKNNADNAQQANQLASQACSFAEKGGDVVSKAVKAMEEINASSEKIAEIIGVIDGIAFQTNLLALNASVEAARAGEQGRGFAVVATEVRNLAGRSATAAREIKELIQDSAKKVETGANLVNQSGETLEEIVAGVRKVGMIISEIAVVSREQSAGIDQVNRAVISMDEVTQHNAALAEQTSTASSAMKDKASDMDSLMDSFKLQPEEVVSTDEPKESNGWQ